MQRVAFKMKLFKGCEAIYKSRHEAIWPQLKLLLQQAGIKDYSIFLDEETLILFGYFTMEDAAIVADLQHHPIMKEWWFFMKDIMETNDDNSPVTIHLKELFYLP